MPKPFIVTALICRQNVSKVCAQTPENAEHSTIARNGDCTANAKGSTERHSEARRLHHRQHAA